MPPDKLPREESCETEKIRIYKQILFKGLSNSVSDSVKNVDVSHTCVRLQGSNSRRVAS